MRQLAITLQDFVLKHKVGPSLRRLARLMDKTGAEFSKVDYVEKCK